MIGYVDRIEDGYAVVLLEADGEVVDQVDLPIKYFDLEVDTVVDLSVTIDQDETQERTERMEDRFETLSERLDGDDK